MASGLHQVVMGDQWAGVISADDLTAGTVLASISVPTDAVIIDFILLSTDMDTNATPTLTLHVGRTDDLDAYLVDSTVAQAGGTVRMSDPGAIGAYAVGGDDAETGLTVSVGTGAATAAAGVISFTAWWFRKGA